MRIITFDIFFKTTIIFWTFFLKTRKLKSKDEFEVSLQHVFFFNIYNSIYSPTDSKSHKTSASSYFYQLDTTQEYLEEVIITKLNKILQNYFTESH